MPVAGGPFIQKTGILLEVDAADKTSYSGTGTTWINQITPGTFNGTLNNVSFNSSDANGALVFTGSNTFVDFGNLGSSLTSSFSFQVAFKPAPTASGQPYTILSYASASATSSFTFKLDYTSSNQTVVLSVFSTGSGAARAVHTMSGSANSGSWNIVHGTFGSRLAALYVNGLNVSTADTTGSVVGYNTSNRLYTGLNFGSTSGYYSGSIGNIIVNNADLNIATINKNYNAIASRFGLAIQNTGVDPAATAFFTRVSAAGGTLSVLEQQAINQLVVDMKAAGIWGIMKAIYPMVGASSAACSQNLKSANFTGTFSSGWTFANTGVKGNGSSNIFNTTLIPNTTLSQNDAHISCYIRDNATNGKMQMGQYTSGRVAIIGAKYNTTSAYIGINNTDNISSADTGTVKGMLTVSRIESTQFKYYKNNTLYDTKITNSTVPGTFSIYIGCINDGNNAFAADTCEFAFGSIGDGLTDAQTSNLYTAVQRFNTTLGRQV